MLQEKWAHKESTGNQSILYSTIKARSNGEEATTAVRTHTQALVLHSSGVGRERSGAASGDDEVSLGEKEMGEKEMGEKEMGEKKDMGEKEMGANSRGRRQH